MRPASRWKARPSSVRISRRRTRWNKVSRSSASSNPSRRLTAGWLRFMARAAPITDPSATTARKARRALMFIASCPVSINKKILSIHNDNAIYEFIGVQ